MSYWDEAQLCLSEMMANGWLAVSEAQRHHALRMLNLLHTDTGVKMKMQDMYRRAVALGDCGNILFDPANADIFQTGSSKQLAPGMALIHLATSDSINRLTGLAGQTTADFRDTFGAYIESRIRQKKALWIAEDCGTANTFMGICKAARELGLYHFGLLPLEQPIVAYHLRTTRVVNAIKPNWAHAFDAWYFDPWPEGGDAPDAHGRARCLETGKLLRKEWVIHPAEMTSALEVAEVFLSHDVDETSALPDFKALGAGYWPATDARAKQLQKVGTP